MSKFDYTKIKTLVFQTTVSPDGIRGCMSKKRRPYLIEVRLIIPEEIRKTITDGYDLTTYVEKTTNLFVLSFLKFNNKLTKNE